ncbi:MAG: ABC transporter substrate-binding protein [Solidesulfovibrio sp.]
MHRIAAKPFRLALVLTSALLLVAVPTLAETITDMAGRTVAVPDAPKRVYALSPPDSLLVYAVAPCLLAGWNYPLPAETVGFLAPCAQKLPILGGFFSKDATPDKAALTTVAPDLVIGGSMAKPHRDFDSFFTASNIPVLYMESESVESYPNVLRFLGRALGRQERGDRLSAYADETLAVIRKGLESIPQDKRLSVYYAEGGDGLYTEGRGSFHTEVLELAGGVNVHAAPQTRRIGLDKVDLETVRAYAPQVILAQDDKCRDLILASPAWKDIPAVRDGRVLLLPDLPFNWFDRPPSFMRLLGLRWLANALYPEVFPFDMRRETKAFFKLFLEKDLTDAEARALFAQKQPGKL